MGGGRGIDFFTIGNPDFYTFFTPRVRFKDIAYTVNILGLSKLIKTCYDMQISASTSGLMAKPLEPIIDIFQESSPD